jgi:hypothetical protein
MDHQSQYLLGFGLELFDLRLCFGRHGPYNVRYTELGGLPG